MKKIYLVRHGETEANNKEVIPSKEEPLNETGLRQAAQLAERVHDLNFETVIVSDFPRAQQTAEPLCKLKNITPKVESAFGEILDPANLHGVHKDELELQEFWQKRDGLIDSDPEWTLSGGESLANVLRRVRQAREILETHESDDILVVSHGFFLKSFIIATLLGTDIPSSTWLKAVHRCTLSNTGISLLVYDEKWKVVLMNDHAHFAE